jgi:hypothetical protein
MSGDMRAAYTSAAFAAYGVAIPAPAGSPAEAQPDVPAHLVVPLREPQPPECLACGDREGPLHTDPGGRRYASGAEVQYCGRHVPDASPVQAAAAVISAEMDDSEGSATANQLAAAEQNAGILFDPARFEAAVNAAREQARAEYAAELTERGRQLAVMADYKHRLDAVLRLIEGRPGDDAMLVREILGAMHGERTPRDNIPMTLGWTRKVDLPDGGALEGRAIVECITAHGGRAALVVDGADRLPLASLLDAEVRDIHAPCPTEGCGTPDDYDASDPSLFGWARVEVAGIADSGPRWYCSPRCVSNALARAGEELAEADDRAALDGGL